MQKKKSPQADAGTLLAELIRTALLDKKAESITVLPIPPDAGIADCFIICQSDNSVHNRAIADGCIASLQEQGLSPWHVEGQQDGSWIVIDYVDVVVHVMLASVRSYYSLETLWNDRAGHRQPPR
jgi:ribosome-associated protein